MSEQTKLPDIVERLRGREQASLREYATWRTPYDVIYQTAADEIERLRSPAPAEATPSPTGTELALDEAKRHIAILTKFWMDSAGWHKASEDARAFIGGVPTPAPAEDGEEMEKLKHDIASYITIASDLATENEGLREALQRMRDYAWHALEQFKDRRGHLDISGFHTLIEVADAALSSGRAV